MGEHDETETSWKDDLRTELVHRFLGEAIGSAAAAEMDLPHIVVCEDGETGAVSYSGPFPDGLSALVFAERENAIDRELNEGAPLGFSVAALHPG